MRYFRRLDLFAVDNRLYTQDSKFQFQTTGGAFLTLILILITIFTFVVQYEELLDRNNPNVIENFTYESTPEKYIFTPEDFFIIGITDKGGNLITPDQQKIAIKVFSNQLTIDSSGVQNNYEFYTLKSCAESTTMQQLMQVIIKFIKFQQLVEIDEIISNAANLAYCFEPSQEQPIILQGQPGTEKYSMFQFQIEILVEPVDVGLLSIIIPKYQLNYQQGGNPYKKTTKSFKIQMDQDKTVVQDFYYRHSYVDTTENFFYYSPKTFVHGSPQFASMAQTQVNRRNSMIGTFSFYLTDEVKKSQRNYSNLLDILGNIAGLINFLTLVLKILTFPLQRYFYNSFFTYEFFSIADADGNNKKSQVQPSQVQAEFDQQEQIPYNNIHQGNKFRLFSFAKNYLKKKDFSKQLSRGNQVIENVLKTEHIMEIHKDVVMLKYLLLTQNEKKLMHCIKQPDLMQIQSSDQQEEEKEQNLEDPGKKQHQLNYQNMILQRSKPNQKELLECYKGMKTQEGRSQNFLKILDPQEKGKLEKLLTYENEQGNKQVLNEEENQIFKAVDNLSNPMEQ